MACPTIQRPLNKNTGAFKRARGRGRRAVRREVGAWNGLGIRRTPMVVPTVVPKP
jgi:hypothetical protein